MRYEQDAGYKGEYNAEKSAPFPPQSDRHEESRDKYQTSRGRKRKPGEER